LGKGQWNSDYSFFNKVDWVDKQCRTCGGKILSP
jgi:hypothetical protein